jgi:acyl-coenzyme A synthetase/AMP-(fatty) acid ligase
MKNKVLLTLLIVGAFALGVVYVRVYDHVQAQAAATHARQVADQKKIDDAESARAAKEVAEKAKLAQECQDGLTAYNKLTLAQQKATPKPECNLQQVQ